MYLIKSSSFKLLFFLLLDLSWISKIQVNKPAVLRRAEQIQARRPVKKEWQVRAFLKKLFPLLYRPDLFPRGHKTEFHSSGIST